MAWTDSAAALAGVCVGGLISFLTSTRAESARRRNDQEARWTELRLSAYETYGQAVGRLATAACSLAATTGLMRGPQPVEPAEGARHIAEADRDVALAYERVHLVGDAPTAQAARRLRIQAWELSDCAQGLVPATAESWEASYDRFRVARARFQDSARADLHVPGHGADRSPEGNSIPRPPRPASP
ncbi:hypothetical protein [Streptomyces sp. NPDC048338]|uniref:hypothetical protein n=1 Tax=Streptomyces sp. NPDC048338 TaxID=3365536 RepID=UPI0037245B5E